MKKAAHSKSNKSYAAARRKPSDAYLSYIEETPVQYQKLKKVAQKATRNAIAEAKSKHLPVTYLKENWVVREQPDGAIEKIRKLDRSGRLKVTVGDTFSLSEMQKSAKHDSL